MNTNSFPYIYYCDLEIINLKIWSAKQWNTQMVYITDKPRLNTPVFNVYLCEHRPSDLSSAKTYREVAMRSGYYIGHHFGKPAYLKWIDEYNMVLICDDPGRIIWSYVIKIVLTLFSYKQNILHVKGSTVEYKNKVFLIMGRGRSGKTEFVKTLCEHGAKMMGNTHALIKDGMAFGIKSNVRVRTDGKEKYCLCGGDLNIPHYSGWLPLGGLFWIQYRVDGNNIISRLDINEAFHNLRWFTEAIGNWEMKEDIADYFGSDPIQFAKCMKKIDDMVQELCKKYSVYYTNLDIHSDDGRNKVIGLMNKLIS